METTTTPAVDIDTVTGAIQSVLDVFLDNLTVANVAAVLAIVIGACLVLYLFYWGVRKGMGMLKGTFESGNFHV